MGKEKKGKNKVELPAELCCPLSGELFKNPVIATNGLVYDRRSLEKLYMEQTTSGEEGTILLPDGTEIKNKLIPDRAMKAKIGKFLKENPGFVMPLSEESKQKFVSALSSEDKNQLHLSICQEPALLSAKLFGEKTVFQHLLATEGKASMETLLFLLNIAKTQWTPSSPSLWYDFFENHIANGGKISLIANAVLSHLLEVNDNNFSEGNTLLHIAAKRGHKELTEWLIVEGGADTYLENADGKRAKQVALPGSGIAQLLRDYLNKKALKQVCEKELNERIKKLETQNAAMRTELERREVLAGQMQENVKKLESQISALKSDLERRQLLSAQSQKELSEKCKKLEQDTQSLKLDQAKASKRFDSIKLAHSNLVELAWRKGLFAVKGRLVSTKEYTDRVSISVEAEVHQCPYEANNFSNTDTYVTLSSSSSDHPRYRGAFFRDHVTKFSPGLSSEEEKRAYRSCVVE